MILRWGVAAVSHELTSFNGYRMIRIVVETEDYEELADFIYMGAAVDQETPARLVLMSDYWVFQFYSNIHPSFNPPSWASLKSQFETKIVPFIVATIDWATTGSTGDVSSHEISAAADKFFHKVFVIPVFTDAEVLVMQASLYGLDNADNYDFGQLQAADVPCPSNQSSGQGDGQTLTKIAEALSVMATTTRVTWINNEGGFADLVSGDIVTP